MGLCMNCKDLCIYINVHRRALTMEEALHGQVNRMIWPVDVRQTLSLATPVLARWVYEQSNHGGRERGSAWTQSIKKLAYLLLLLNVQTTRNGGYCQTPDTEAFFKETTSYSVAH